MFAKWLIIGGSIGAGFAVMIIMIVRAVCQA